MNIKEAIEHCYEVAERMYKDEPCSACAAEHEQLAHWLEDLMAYWAKIPFDRLGEVAALVKAQDEGRVNIDPPPAKEGDPKPGCFYEDGGTIWCLGLAPDGDDEPCDRCKACWYCESGDYADDRTEAEAALGGGGDG